MIVETDIGRDPDDFFAIAWLLENNVKIDAITITPGDPDQIAVARLLCKMYGRDIPIGVPSLTRDKRSSGGVHYALLEKYKMPKTAKADGIGSEILSSINTENLIILGPCTNIANWLEEKKPYISQATMQGGFLPNNNSKFAGMNSCGTFNLNGNLNASRIFLNYPIAERRQMCGKNVCHFVKLTQDNTKMFKGFLRELADMYTKGGKEKAMHDLVAVVCHLFPIIGQWVRGKTIYTGNTKWSTHLYDDGDFILESINEDLFWLLASGQI